MTPEDIELLASKLSALLKMEKDDEEDEDKKDDLEAEEEDKGKEDRKDDLEADDAPEGMEDRKDDLESACPSSDNTFVPGEVDETKARKMRSDSERIKLSRLEKRIGQLDAENADLRLRLRRAEREKDLKQLEAEGFTFDIVEELEHVETLEDSDYEKHMGRARKLYRRVPVGREMIRTAEPEIGLTKDDMKRVVKLSQEKGIPYAEALKNYKETK